MFEGNVEDLIGDPGQPGIAGPPGPAVCILFTLFLLKDFRFL